MALRIINTSTELSGYTQRTILDGREYLLRFLWNMREAKWYLSIADQTGSPIVDGIKVVADFPLTRRIVDERCFPGSLIAMDTSEKGLDPGLTELGDRVVLVYDSVTEV